MTFLLAVFALVAAALAADSAAPPATQLSMNPVTRPATQPSRITLHYTDAPMTDVVADFSRQADCDLTGHDPNFAQYAAKQRITINVQDGTFWDALEPFINQGWAGIEPRDPQIQLHPPSQIHQTREIVRFDTQNATIAGPLLICPERCRQYIRYSFDAARFDQNLTTLWLCVLAEPKAGVIGLSSQNWLTHCVDEHGDSLLYDNQNHGDMEPINRKSSQNWVWELQVKLKMPEQEATKIAHMSGAMQIQVAGGFDAVSLPLAKIPGFTKTVAGVTLTFKSLSPLQKQRICTLEISAERPGQTPLHASDISHLIKNLRLQDDSGATMISLGSSSRSSERHSLQFTARFLAVGQPPRPPATLLWNIPFDVQTYNVPFELHDIQLPGPPTDATQPSNPAN